MKRKIYFCSLLIIISLLLSACSLSDNQNSQKHHVNIVTSTNVYANLAKNVVGKRGSVSAVISNGNTDPHDFEPTVASAKKVAKANIVIANGLGYDSWMDNLAKSNDLQVIKVGEQLMHKHNGDNPHIWYDLKMPIRYVDFIARKASKIDPADKKYFFNNARNYKNKIKRLQNRFLSINGKKNLPVYVSEPVFDYVLENSHFTIGNKEFEEAVENETDPSAQSLHRMQVNIQNKKVAFFVNNTQTSSSTVNRILNLCRKNKISILNIRETMPNGKTYLQWMNNNYEKLAKVSK